MNGRKIIVFIVGLAAIFILYKLNSDLGDLILRVGIGSVLIYLVNMVIRLDSPKDDRVVESKKTEKVQMEIIYGGNYYDITLEIIITGQIGDFRYIVASKEFWQAVFRFPTGAHPPTLQDLNETIGDYALAALKALNDSISIRYKGECRVGTVNAQPKQNPAIISVESYRPG